MSAPSADYAAAAAYLERTRLPAYVSYVEEVWARGIARESQAPGRIVVRISDGAIVSRAPSYRGDDPLGIKDDDSENPFGKQPLFNVHCYTPLNEDRVQWNGSPVIRFSLKGGCDNENGFTELFVDPQTLRPVAADGNIDTDETSMTVAVEVRYVWLGQYTVPQSIRAHAVGHGWLFWARERGEVDYSGYQFLQTAPGVDRRQAVKPPG